jgi:hypothetical protein
VFLLDLDILNRYSEQLRVIAGALLSLHVH